MSDIEKFEEFQKFFKKYLNKNFGKKCPDYCYNCIVCRVWRTYEEFEALVDEISDLDKYAKK